MDMNNCCYENELLDHCWTMLRAYAEIIDHLTDEEAPEHNHEGVKAMLRLSKQVERVGWPFTEYVEANRDPAYYKDMVRFYGQYPPAYSKQPAA